jgi:hypothetical protein
MSQERREEKLDGASKDGHPNCVERMHFGASVENDCAQFLRSNSSERSGGKKCTELLSPHPAMPVRMEESYLGISIQSSKLDGTNK